MKNNWYLFRGLVLILPAIAVSAALIRCDRREKVVAEFGPHRITLEEFRPAYLEKMKRSQIFDSEQQRITFLHELISRRLLAGEAKALGMHHDAHLRYRIDAYRDWCMRQAHYTRVIEPRVRVDEEDIEETYGWMQEERRIRHLFAETQEQADSLYALLEKGTSFEILAARIFRSEPLAESGGDLGWVSWDQMAYDVAMAAFRQPIHSYTKPVRSNDGYHILEVTDWRKIPLITSEEYELNRKKARALLESKIGEKIAWEYLGAMMQGIPIRIYPQAVKAVGEKLRVIVAERAPSPWDAMHERPLGEAEAEALEAGLWDLRDEVMAVVGGEAVTVGEAIAALRYVPYDALYSSYKTALDFVFRDVALTREARRMGLGHDREVRLKTRLYEEDLLQLLLRRKCVREVAVGEAEVRALYEREGQSTYFGAPFDSVRSMMHERLVREKKDRCIPDFVNSRLDQMKVRLYPEIIHQYYDSVYRGQR